MRSSLITAGQTGRIEQINNLRSDAYLSSMLSPHEQATPGLTLYVEPGTVYFGATLLNFAGGSSPSFTAPATNPRIDALVINRSGTLVRIAGAENASPTAPLIPTYYVPICYVYNRVGQTTIRDLDTSGQGYVYRDLRTPLRYPLDDGNAYTLTYNVDETVATVTETQTGTVYTLSYNTAGDVSSYTDGVNTWTFTYTNGLVTAVVKT